MKPTLLVLAAGMGSRYGGLKQMDGLGPSGETIIDYSIYDAVQAGFGKVVYIVREYFKEQMEQAVKQLETSKDQFLRLSAEYDNYRKRTTKEKENIYQDAKADTIKAFLAVYDNLERAAAAEGGEDSPHKKGLEMIFQQYKNIHLVLY